MNLKKLGHPNILKYVYVSQGTSEKNWQIEKDRQLWKKFRPK